jgi:transposase
VTLPPDLSKLSHPEKDGLILTLAAQLAAAQERIAMQDGRIATLEARLDALTRPAKTPDNSSKPPSQGQKQDRPPTERPPRKSCPGVGRTLHPNPDRVVDARLAACLKCQAAFPEAVQTPQLVYERFELPAIKPDVTQVRLFGGRCVCCGERVSAEAPAGLEPGSPFGQSIAALVVYLHYAQGLRQRCHPP